MAVAVYVVVNALQSSFSQSQSLPLPLLPLLPSPSPLPPHSLSLPFLLHLLPPSLHSSADVHLELGGEDHERLYAVLRDLSTLLQVLGRLAEHFGGTHFLTRLESSKALFQG